MHLSLKITEIKKHRNMQFYKQTRSSCKRCYLTGIQVLNIYVRYNALCEYKGRELSTFLYSYSYYSYYYSTILNTVYSLLILVVPPAALTRGSTRWNLHSQQRILYIYIYIYIYILYHFIYIVYIQ